MISIAKEDVVCLKKYSKQRELILRAVQDSTSHPTADEVYTQIRQKCPTISLGTVYRNLNLLSDHFLIRKISMPNTSDRFDGRLDEHYHMTCSRCGRVFDAVLPAMEEVAQKTLTATGFTVTGIHLIISGICRQCAEQEQLQPQAPPLL